MVNVAILDDRKHIRSALKSLFGNNTCLHVIFEGCDASHLLKKMRQKSPDLILIGNSCCLERGESDLELVQRTWPAVLIILLPYVEGSNSMEQLKTIFSLRSKERKLNRGEHLPVVDKNTFDLAGLTRREKEILEVLLEGLSYKQVATKSFISVNTLNAHIRSIYYKLHVHSLAELISKFG